MTGFRFLYPPECDPAQEVRMKSFDFIQALQIDDMVVLQNDRYRGYSDLTLEKFFFNGSECVAVSAGDCGRSCRTSDTI